MAYAIREIKRKEDYYPLSARSDASFNQSWEYGDWQEKAGRKVFRYSIEKDGVAIGTFQAIRYPLLLEKFYLYIPHGPVLAEMNAEIAELVRTELSRLCNRERAVFARCDFFPLTKDALILKRFTKSPFSSYFSAVFQSKYDWILDISKDEETILKAMHPKTRYSITLAYKKGVSYETIRGKDMMQYFEVFYALMQETAARGKFSLHPKEYYRGMFESAEHDDSLALYIAKFEGEVVATHFVIFYGTTAFYPFGASSSKERNRMPTYGLHWNAIRDGKTRGTTFYNFGAIEADENLSHDNWQGISAFKRKFGGQLLEYSDFYDVVVNPLVYHLYTIRKWVKRKL